MLIEIHMIQNHSPANLNRDDLGAPKTCIFGGFPRARISSQCLKRSVRRSAEFAAELKEAKVIY
jgi:CRISPR system Cascade subunit CasC